MRSAMPDQHSIAMKYSMLKQAIDRPVALVGMMGSGKSLIGRRLAGQLALPFIDSDTEVETAAGISISEIFELAGEPKFRSMERDAIRSAANAGPSILSTGGGSICAPETAELLRERTHVVWLDAEPETLLSRIGSVGSRPLLHTDDPLQTLREACRDTAGRLWPRPYHGEDGPPVGGGGGKRRAWMPLTAISRRHSSGLL